MIESPSLTECSVPVPRALCALNWIHSPEVCAECLTMPRQREIPCCALTHAISWQVVNYHVGLICVRGVHFFEKEKNVYFGILYSSTFISFI